MWSDLKEDVVVTYAFLLIPMKTRGDRSCKSSFHDVMAEDCKPTVMLAVRPYPCVALLLYGQYSNEVIFLHSDHPTVTFRAETILRILNQQRWL